jgi:hypothetical protein
VYAYTNPSGPFMIRDSGSVKLYCTFGAGFVFSDPYPRFQLGHAPRLSGACLASRSGSIPVSRRVNSRPIISRDGGDYSFDFCMEMKNTCIALDSHKVQ